MSPDQVNAADPGQIVPFLKKTLPFSELDNETLKGIAAEFSIDFYPKGVRVLTRGETMVESMMLIQRGGMKLYLTREDGEIKLVDFRGEGGVVGALGCIRDTYSSLNVDTVEDTFVFKLPKKNFRELIEKHPAISRFFLKTLSEDYVSRAFSELRQQHLSACPDTSLYMYSMRVGDIIKRPPVKMASGATIRQAARLMHEQGIGSLLITDPYERPEGIVTDKDLRRAVSEGESYDSPVEFIMSSPVATVAHTEVCFEALLKMMSAKIHHLAVTRDDKVAGMVTSHDIMVLQGRSPIALFRDIQRQNTFDGLYEQSQRTPLIVGTLMEEGAKAANVTRMLTILNDMVLDKLLSLLQEELGPPPVPFCWVLMGSEGRKEQTIKTDQDNALVYRDPRNEDEARACEEYFKNFGEQAVAHLQRCGYAPDPFGLMASNSKWRMPFKDFRDYLERLILLPEPDEILHATIFFDFRGGYGNKGMAQALWDHVSLHAKRQDVFIRHLAQDCLRKRAPISFFRNFIVEKDGEHKNTLDLKEKSMVQFVDFARTMALRAGIQETNTLDRLKMLSQGGFVSQELCAEAAWAYEFLMQVRLVHQLSRINQGKEPNNFIDPGTLTDLEKQTLKESFAVIGRMHNFLRDEFRLRQ